MPEWIEVTREEQIVVLQTRVRIPNGSFSNLTLKIPIDFVALRTA